MSYRDLRNFTESLRVLAYPRLVSIQNFLEPNFHLVAEILLWLIKRYDPNADILTDVSTEADRVLFIKAVAQFMATNASVKLNTRKLYRGDGHAVIELLKLTNVLRSAMQINEQSASDLSSHSHGSLDLASKAADLKSMRLLASEITQKGGALYDILRDEADLRETRTIAIARPLEIEEIEADVRKNMDVIDEKIRNIQSLTQKLAADEENLSAKIDKKKLELERNEKRLKSLQSVRPAFMDEYEKIEEELGKQYEVYIDRFRNLAYLENLLEDHARTEQDKFEETEQSLKRMQSIMREALRTGEASFDNINHDEIDLDKVEYAPNRQGGGRGGAARGVRAVNKKKIEGNLDGGSEDEDSQNIADSGESSFLEDHEEADSLLLDDEENQDDDLDDEDDGDGNSAASDDF